MVSASHALYTKDAIYAFRIPDHSIKVDGKPDGLWQLIAAQKSGFSKISFNDYSKILLLGPDGIRNSDPALHYAAPESGSVSLVAAYDSHYLYFLFLVRETHIFNSGKSCLEEDGWRADAVELFLDGNAWNEEHYSLFFSEQEGGGAFGTSSKTLQINKTISSSDRQSLFYKDRFKDNRFAVKEAHSEIPDLQFAVGSHPMDSHSVAVEYRIPFWGGGSGMPVGNFSPGSSIYVSWGYNDYPDTLPSDCTGLPIKYAWAKNFKTYPAFPASERLPGWLNHDSTHYDPTRSWDGWGRLHLKERNTITGACAPESDSRWDAEWWKVKCEVSTTIGSGTDGAKYNPWTGSKGPGKKDEEMILYSLKGKMLLRTNWNGGQPNLNNSNLEAGVYFALLGGGGQRFRYLHQPR